MEIKEIKANNPTDKETVEEQLYDIFIKYC